MTIRSEILAALESGTKTNAQVADEIGLTTKQVNNALSTLVKEGYVERVARQTVRLKGTDITPDEEIVAAVEAVGVQVATDMFKAGAEAALMKLVDKDLVTDPKKAGQVVDLVVRLENL